MKAKVIMLSVALAAFSFQVNAQCDTPGTSKTAAKSGKNIVEVASSLDDFSTLVAAVQTAQLVETLSGEGPFTVFAPTNESFSKLPAGTVENLLKPESKDLLTRILTYHVVAGNFEAADVLAAIEKNNGSFTIKTVAGDDLTAQVKKGKVVLTDAQGNESIVTQTDVKASNGTIHVIEKVVMPK